MKNKNMRLKGQLRMYMQWPLIMTILLLAMNIWMYMTDQKVRTYDDGIRHYLCNDRWIVIVFTTALLFWQI